MVEWCRGQERSCASEGRRCPARPTRGRSLAGAPADSRRMGSRGSAPTRRPTQLQLRLNRPGAPLSGYGARPSRYARIRAKAPQSRAARLDSGGSARHRRLHGDLHPGGKQLGAGVHERDAQPRVEPLADLRAVVPRPVLGGASGDSLRAASRRPLSVPACSRPLERGNRDGVSHQPLLGAPAGAVDGARARPVRGDDRVAATRGHRRARALSLYDRRGRDRDGGVAALSGDRRAGQRRLSGHPLRLGLFPAGRAREDRDRDLPGQLPAR